jgi:hypothetical protein
MRFAVAAAALAGTALAAHGEPQSTVYSTEYYTITSCGPSVTNCPYASTVVSSSVIPLTTSTIYSTLTRTVTDCPDTVSHCPADSTVLVTETVAVSTTVCPVVHMPTSTADYEHETDSYVHSPHPTSTLVTVAPVPQCPGTSVKTIKTSITTVIPTIIYETVEVPCPTGPASSPSGYTPSGRPSSTKPPQPTFTAGASTIGRSVALAAVAGLVALLA